MATPAGGKELRRTLELLRGSQAPYTRDLRAALRKAAKALDQKNCELTQAQLQHKALELQVRKLKPKRRQKVETDPNKRFANLGHIQAAQAKARAKEAQKKKSSNTAIEDLSGAIIF